MKEKFISVSLVECPFLLSSYAAACDSNKKYEQQMIDNFSHVCLNTVHFLGFTICGILNHEKKIMVILFKLFKTNKSSPIRKYTHYINQHTSNLLEQD